MASRCSVRSRRVRATDQAIPNRRQNCGVEPAEHDRCIGHRRFLAAAAVAGRPRLGPGRVRPDAQAARAIEPCDRPAAGADRIHIHHRHAHGKTGDAALRRGSPAIAPSTSAMSLDVPPTSMVRGRGSRTTARRWRRRSRPRRGRRGTTAPVVGARPKCRQARRATASSAAGAGHGPRRARPPTVSR